MAKFIVSLLLLVIIALIGVLVVQNDPGFVQVKYASYSLETSLAFGIVAVIVIGILLQVLLRLLLAFWRTPRTMKQQAHKRRVEKSRKLLNQGLMDLAEGRFQQSENNLIKLVEFSDNPLLNYLAAARAAQQLGHYDNRDSYLKAAHEAKPEAQVAIAVTQAELQLASKQTESALATLMHLKSVAPRHDYASRLLARVYLKLERWSELCELLPELRKKKLYDEDRLGEMEHLTYRGCLDSAVSSGIEALEKAWSSIPKNYQSDADLVLHYIALRGQEQPDNRVIEQIIIKSVNKHWNANLVEYYGRLKVEDSSAQLATVEKWQNDYGSSHILLTALGRISIRLKLWGKAQSYLEASIGIKPTPECCFELAELIRAELPAETDKACQYYRQGLNLSLGNRGK